MTPKICLVPKLSGLGGMVSFEAKFIQGLDAQGISHTFDLNDPEITAVLVIGGTWRHIAAVRRAKRRGVRIVQRLNGMNWLHKVERTPLRAAWRASANNALLGHIRRHLADRIVYQSAFSQSWWDRVYGPLSIPTQITHNGIDLSSYTPEGSGEQPTDRYRILLVEGRLTGGYARGLETAVKMAAAVQRDHPLALELMVVGDVSPAVREKAQALAPELNILWQGIVPREAIPELDRSAHVLYSADLNAACPNSVIEALACGLPVVAYDTGALAELVQGGAGEVVPYGSDYWQLEDPVIAPLAEACAKILENNTSYRLKARQCAEAAFGLDEMVEGYLKALVD
jgi:glycosyltransferase involved in cell wall biosynthesis